MTNISNVSHFQAANAYKDATRVAERIVSEVGAGQASPVAPEANSLRPTFETLIGDSLQQARDGGYRSEGVSSKAIANEAELHDLVTSVANAELTLNTVVAIRDRVISAYQDIIKMPI